LVLSFYRVCWNCHFTGFVGTVTIPLLSDLRPLRLGEEKKERRKKEDRNHRAKYNGLPYYIG